MKKLLLVIASFGFLGLNAQTNWKAEQRLITTSWFANPNEFKDDFQFSLRHLEAPYPGGEAVKSELQKRKELIAEKYANINPSQARGGARSEADSLSIGESFPVTLFVTGNPLVGGRPNDNTLAISNEGKLLTSYNSQLWGYDIAQDTFMFNDEAKHPSFTQFLTNYADTNISLYFPFDPKLIYDNVNDRFIFIYLTGRDPDDSGVIVGFSQSSNPNTTWKVYYLDGNPLGDNTWTDYPQIAINNHSLYLSLNQLYPDSSWITGFSQTIIWQMDLASAYAGNSELPVKLWSGANYQGSKLRYLRPAKSGLGPDADDMYFVANRPFDLENDSIFIVHLTGDVFDENGTMTTDLAISNLKYGLPPNANQPGGSVFLTNDARALGAVRIQNEIQFVGNTIDPNTGNVGVYHGVIEDVTNPTVEATIIADPSMDYGYPNIAFMGEYIENRDVVIFFDHSSNTDFAGNSAVFFNSSREYGPIKTLATGEAPVDMLTGNEERWGDYSGCQRKFNEVSTAWVAGYYGHGNNRAGTWISEISGRNSTPQGLLESANRTEFSVYPNPTQDFVSLVFEMPRSQKAKVYITDINGKIVHTLAQDKLKAGKNELNLSLAPLTSGTYFLIIESASGQILNQKLVKN